MEAEKLLLGSKTILLTRYNWSIILVKLRLFMCQVLNLPLLNWLGLILKSRLLINSCLNRLQ